MANLITASNFSGNTILDALLTNGGQTFQWQPGTLDYQQGDFLGFYGGDCQYILNGQEKAKKSRCKTPTTVGNSVSVVKAISRSVTLTY